MNALPSSAGFEPPSAAPRQSLVTFYRPAPDLAALVKTYCVGDMHGEIFEPMVPDWTAMAWHLSGDATYTDAGPTRHPQPRCTFSGSRDRSSYVHSGAGRTISATILPAGWARFSDLPAHRYTNRVVPMREVFGADAEALRERFQTLSAPEILNRLDDFFRALAARRPDPDPIVDRAYAALRDPDVRSVDDWAARLGLSMRQLQRVSLTWFGIAPKTLLRRERLMRTVNEMWRAPTDKWSAVIDESYADQAHFSREFRYFMRMTPSEYLTRPNQLPRALGKR